VYCHWSDAWQVVYTEWAGVVVARQVGSDLDLNLGLITLVVSVFFSSECDG
jgi:hypothetical protein